MPGKKIEISDDCLMKQLKLKSYRAFEVVFNRYYAGLYRFALAYLMNRELAEDVVQEVFLFALDFFAFNSRKYPSEKLSLCFCKTCLSGLF